MNKKSPSGRHFIIPFMLFVVGTLPFWYSELFSGFIWLTVSLYGLGIGSVIWIFMRTVYDGQADIIREYAQFAAQLKNLDYRQQVAFGIKFPTVGIRLGATEPLEVLDGTNILFDDFKHYLRTSDSRQVSPLRGWRTKQHSADTWHEITAYLVKLKYVYKDSAAGSHSHLWAGAWYSHLREIYLTPRDLINFGEQ